MKKELRCVIKNIAVLFAVLMMFATIACVEGQEISDAELRYIENEAWMVGLVCGDYLRCAMEFKSAEALVNAYIAKAGEHYPDHGAVIHTTWALGFAAGRAGYIADDGCVMAKARYQAMLQALQR